MNDLKDVLLRIYSLSSEVICVYKGYAERNKMLFNSYIFILFFLPITLIGYFMLNKYAYGNKGMSGIIWLFFMSLWFYGYEKPEYLLLILGSIIVNYFIGRVILFLKRKGINNRSQQKWVVVGGSIFNLGILFYFKYADFFVDSIEDFFHAEWNVEVALPLGISFFTFQQLSYVIDCYRVDWIIIFLNMLLT